MFFLFFPKAFDSEFLTLRGLMEEAALEKLEAQGLTIPIYILISSIQAITFAPFFNMFAALGEEVGWRGALYPYLKEKLGVTKGRIVGGVIWGSWHWPVMIFAGYEYGKEYIGAPVLGPIVFCLFNDYYGSHHLCKAEKKLILYLRKRYRQIPVFLAESLRPEPTDL